VGIERIGINVGTVATDSAVLETRHELTEEPKARDTS
jgi:hypothetical protein